MVWFRHKLKRIDFILLRWPSRFGRSFFESLFWSCLLDKRGKGKGRFCFKAKKTNGLRKNILKNNFHDLDNKCFFLNSSQPSTAYSIFANIPEEPSTWTRLLFSLWAGNINVATQRMKPNPLAKYSHIRDVVPACFRMRLMRFFGTSFHFFELERFYSMIFADCVEFAVLLPIHKEEIK